MNIRKHLLTFLATLPILSWAQVTDRILLGDSQSETSHGLITYCPQYTAAKSGGLLGQTGRTVKPFHKNPFCGNYPGIYGGEYSFVLRVDGTRQNYLTLRSDGGEATVSGERYHIQIDNKNLQDYSRDAVAFSSDKAPGAFCYSTLIIPRVMTDGKSSVVVRVRSLGRYWGYAPQGNFASYQRTVDNDLPALYAVYSSTDPNVTLADEQQGALASYSAAPSRGTAESLAAMKSRVQTALANAIKGEVQGNDFKPAYQNNNFNVVQCMGYAYHQGIYGTTASDLARKIRTAIDSMVYINNLVKSGVSVSVSAKGQTATLQSAGSGWGGLFGGQGLGMYLLWRAGKVTDAYLNQSVDLGKGAMTRRDQWIEAFRESFDAGCTYSGRRYITNQLMESSHSVYGAALALYALDGNTYHNAPKLALRFMREALGIEEWTGVPANARFDGSIKDADGYPDFQLGSPEETNTRLNYWGKHFHATTECGNGREQGYTCTSCYGNMSGRIADMYIATLNDPFIGTAAGGNGDNEILKVSVNNARFQSYFTYPAVDGDGYRGIIGESSICWRNRYDPGKAFYGSLIAGALTDDDEMLGRILQAYNEGHYSPETIGRLFPYYTNSYYLVEAIDKLIAYAEKHGADHAVMPSTDGQPDYAVGDSQDAVVAVKHGSNHLFVNFLAEDTPLSSGKAHIITPTTAKTIQFKPDVYEYYPSGQTVTLPDVYWNGNHKITYPDNPQMAYGGMTYERPAYNAQGDWISSRASCQFYQQLLGRYLVAQNCSRTDSYNLKLSENIKGMQADDLTDGGTVTLSDNIVLSPGETKVYFISSLSDGQTLAEAGQTGADATALKARAAELLTFAQAASMSLSSDNAPEHYRTDAFMPFFRQLTMAAYTANCGSATAEEIAAQTEALEEAYRTFVATKTSYNACGVPGRLDYTKKVGTSGSITVSGKTSVGNAKAKAQLFVPVVAGETGDYVVAVRAKSHVADRYRSTLNVDAITPQQYYDGNVPVDEERAQVIGFSDFEYSTYKWAIHLDAGETAILRYTFDGLSATYTVDLSYTEVKSMNVAERLALEVEVAQSLLDAYADASFLTETDRDGLATAIANARTALEGTSETAMEDAYNALLAAEEDFKGIVAKWSAPTEENYTDALAKATDGEYYIYAEDNGMRRYLKAVDPSNKESNGAETTTDKSEASKFTVSQTDVSGGFVARSWKITSGLSYGGKTVYFTNPAMSGGEINNEGYLRTNNRNNKWNYDTQVLYYNGTAYAIRSTNAMAGDWGEASFWTLIDGKAGYSYTSTFMWHIENEETDGVDDVRHNAGIEPDVYYDIYGRPVKNPTKGIYIRSGKKYVFK